MASATIAGDDTTKKQTTINEKSKTNSSSTEISMKDFLDFLRSAYQVQESVEGILAANGMMDAINWLKLKESTIIDNKSTDETKNDEKSVKTLDTKKSPVDNNDPIKRKLSEVLAEGLLDSVLPYLVPQNSSGSTSRKSSISKLSSTNTTVEKNVTVCQGINERSIKKKPVENNSNSTKIVNKTDSEVEIHVCDETKNIKKDFQCNQKLLIEKMGYFAEVTIGQRLEDMDISVHCDIGIFEWLMKWVKKDTLLEDDLPKLDTINVIPILVSAAFLQMEPLQYDCLLFCHENMNEILRITQTNLTCLNDQIIQRLSAMYTNSEVELIRDRKDKIQSRLFIKLIQSLCEIETESVRGHWSSLAYIYRCSKCEQIVNPFVCSKIPCIASCMSLQYNGSIVSNHVRDPSWNINDYIIKLHKSLRTWRKVYWYLWGNAHFLYCLICKRYFSSHQIGWCRYHPDPPQFFTLDAQKAPLPVGRYPCCGERAYRFQLLYNYSGCQFRDHSICTKDVRHSAILTMLETYRHLIEEEPPELLFPERLTRLVARDPSGGAGTSNGGDNKRLVCKETFWWDGFEIIPPRPKMGLLNLFSNRSHQPFNESAKYHQMITTYQLNQIESSDNNLSDEGSVNSTTSSTTSSSTSSNSSQSSSGSGSSVESNPPPAAINKTTKIVVKKDVKRRKVKKRRRIGRLWQNNLSARSNQDIQRSYEEQAIKQMINLLNKKFTVNSTNERTVNNTKPTTSSRNLTTLGGIWVRLESEWRESNNQLIQNNNKLRNMLNLNSTANNRLSKMKGTK